MGDAAGYPRSIYDNWTHLAASFSEALDEKMRRRENRPLALHQGNIWPAWPPGGS